MIGPTGGTKPWKEEQSQRATEGDARAEHRAGILPLQPQWRERRCEVGEKKGE